MCKGHARCTMHPVYRVTVHRIGYCNKPPGADGVYELCSACTRAAAYRMGEMIGAAYEAMPEIAAGETLKCDTCQRKVGGLADVFDVEWMTEGATG